MDGDVGGDLGVDTSYLAFTKHCFLGVMHIDRKIHTSSIGNGLTPFPPRWRSEILKNSLPTRRTSPDMFFPDIAQEAHIKHYLHP